MRDADYWSLAESRVVRERVYAENPVLDVIPGRSHAANMARKRRAEIAAIRRAREVLEDE